MTNSEKRKLRLACDQVLGAMQLIKRDKYDNIADELSNALLDDWDKETQGALNDLIADIRTRDGEVDTDVLDQQINALALRLGPKFANKVAAPLFEGHLAAFEGGQRDVNFSATVKFNQVDEKAIRALDEHNIYWVRNSFNRVLQDDIKKVTDKVIREGLDYRAAGELFEREFAEQFQQHGTNYWRGFANNVVTRSREIGHINAYEKAGVTEYQVRAVLDHRTTQICRELHGRIFSVSRGIETRDALIEADNPEQVLEIVPWRKPDSVASVPTQELPGGLEFPPYHFRCRTRTTVYRGDKSITRIDYGAEMPDEQKKYLQAYSRAELSAVVDSMRNKRRYQVDPDRVGALADLHNMDKKEFRQYANDLANDAGGIYMHEEKGSWAFMLDNDRAKRLVFLNNGLQVNAVSLDYSEIKRKVVPKMAKVSVRKPTGYKGNKPSVGRNKITIDQAASYLSDRGYRLGSGKFDMDKKTTVYEVQNPDGQKVNLTSEEIKNIIY